LYDYQATEDHEMSFQSGDVIAVTATLDNGWWTGELLDKVRRIPGRSVFPSNFVERIPLAVGYTEDTEPVLFYGKKRMHIRCRYTY
jgi:hypothetical protein